MLRRAALVGLALALVAPAGDSAQAEALGPERPVVALIDSGADVWDLRARGRLWTNPDDPVDGRDDDANGYPDDRYGWDFSAADNDPFDWPSVNREKLVPAGDAVSHGTALSFYVETAAGAAPGPRLMVLRVTDSTGPFTASVLHAAVAYAIAEGAEIISLAIGGDWLGDTVEVAELVRRHPDRIVVIAAGNSGEEIPPDSILGRLCSETHVVCVASTDRTGRRLGTGLTASNYGLTVDVAAFGGPVRAPGRRLQTVELAAVLDADGALAPPSGRSCVVTSAQWPGAAGRRSVREVPLGGRVPRPVRRDGDSRATCPSAAGEPEESMLDGTSVAAGFVTGELAERLHARPDAEPAEIVRRFLDELEEVEQLSSSVRGGRVMLLEGEPPARRNPRLRAVLLLLAAGMLVSLCAVAVVRTRRTRGDRS